MVDSRATIGCLLTRASATSGWTWISRSGKLLRPGDPGPRERDMRRAICLKCFACFRIWLDGWILNILKYFLKKRTKTRVFNNKRVLLLGSLWGYCNNIHVLLYISHAYHVEFETRYLQSLKKACLIIQDKRIFFLDKILLKLTDSMGKCPCKLFIL